jgi:anionic cell wall polymer biosynthesis LytR-Cps2A-Psr (LCP) family protein
MWRSDNVKNNSLKTSLQFNKEKQQRRKTVITFVIAFLSFAVVLAAVSFLILLKSVDFKLSNLVDRKATTTTETQAPESETEPAEYSGNANILAVVSESGGKLDFFGVINFNMDEKQISVLTLDNNQPVSFDGKSGTYASVYSSGGAMGLQRAVEAVTGIKTDRYFDITESNFKKVFSYFGNATVNADEKITYKGDGFVLNLEQGEQSVTSDMLLSYYKYLDSDGRSALTAEVFDYYMNSGRLSAAQQTFESVINSFSTNISMKDFTSVAATADAFIADSMRKPSRAVKLENFPKGEDNNG